MEPESVRKRSTKATTSGTDGNGVEDEKAIEHPAGEVKHGGPSQVLRALLCATYFLGSSCVVHATQILGSPLYWISKDWYYAYMAMTKQSYGLILTTMTAWWAPTVIRASGDASVDGQLRQTKDGRLVCDFPDRLVMIANHQIYTEWLYLWWVGYTNRPSMHGHVYIILKESLKWVPVIGPGMMFFGFVFMSRKMEKDKPRLAHRLQKLKTRHQGPMSGDQSLDPMWLLIFPEGTNLSANTRERSAAWAAKIGQPDFNHVLMPRTTGTYFCLKELEGTVDWVFDVTMGYEGVPRGMYGQDYFTLRSAYTEGRPPKSVNMYWRRLAVSSIPLHSAEAFERWTMEQWRAKDRLLEEFVTTGRFPPSPRIELKGKMMSDGYVETSVRTAHWWEAGKIFVPLATYAMLAYLAVNAYERLK